MSETYAFLKECTAMELVALIAEAREVGDDDLKKAALIEAGIVVRVMTEDNEDRCDECGEAYPCAGCELDRALKVELDKLEPCTTYCEHPSFPDTCLCGILKVQHG